MRAPGRACVCVFFLQPVWNHKRGRAGECRGSSASVINVAVGRSLVARDISVRRCAWEALLMNGQLGADSSSSVADWSLFNGTPVSLIKRKMNHRYSGPRGAAAAADFNCNWVCSSSSSGSVCVSLCVSVCYSFGGSGGLQRSVGSAKPTFWSGLWVFFCSVFHVDPLDTGDSLVTRWRSFRLLWWMFFFVSFFSLLLFQRRLICY